MALPSLKDLSVAFGGLLGKDSNAYAAGLGGAVTAGSVKLKEGVLSKLYAWGSKAGASLGTAGVVLPGAFAAGAAGSGAAAEADFQTKYLGVSISQGLMIGGAVLGGLVLWLLTRSRR